MKLFKPTVLSLALSFALTGCQTSNINSLKEEVINPNEVIKSQSDQRDYRYIQLKNGLKVLMISDPTSEKSAAAMDISAGAFHAPKDRAGLLHFLEHMLFLGTEKYPSAGEYNEFLKKNGGSSNAYTSLEDTNYFFNVKNDAFNEALDRFAQFFIAPTMDPKYVDREKNAVDSEYSLKIKDDARRIREASRQAINPEHPYSMFSVGNLATLADRGDDKVYDALIKAYKRHYSANRMALVLLSNQSLANMEAMVIEKFSAVKNNGLDKPQLVTELLTKKELETRVHIEPLREMRTLEMVFPIIDTQQFSKQKPTRLITHLLAHEGEGSLYQRLNQKGLIESLSAYVNNADALDSFSIEMELTKKGLKQVNQITEDVFAYIDLIKKKGVTEEYYNELKNIAALNFTFQEKSNPMSTVYQLAPVLQNTPANNLLNINYTYEKFNADLIQKYLSELTPNNMQQTIVAPGLSTNKNEPLYDVNYSVNKISKQLINQWSKVKAHPDMKLPALNPFIAEDIKLKESDEKEKPELLVNKAGIQLWHYLDTSFSMPKSSVIVRLESPVIKQSAKNRAMTELASKVIEDNLSAYGYDAKLAGLSYQLFESEKGIGYVVNGYSDKQAELIATINKTITKFDVSEGKFELLKASLLKDLKNAAFSRPIGQVFGRMEREFGSDSFSSSLLASELTAVDLKQLKQFMQTMLSEVALKVLVHGNTDQQEAMALSNKLYQSFLSSAKTGAGYQTKLRQLNDGTQEVVEMQIEHDDSAIVITYPLDVTLNSYLRTRMIGQVLSAAFFNDIRTTQQLGYTVGAFGSEIDDMPTLNFYIQSSKVGPKELERRIDQFIKKEFNSVKEMTDENFAQHKAGLLTNIKRKDKNLGERTMRLWGELMDGFSDFDKREQLAKGISDMTKQDLIDAYQKILIGPKKKRLIVRNFGKAHLDKDYKAALKDKSICRDDQCWHAQ
ncbi:insulinase family protein [Aliikangiella sp. IMCC44359]|uniref:insulinase family protein n=1 Tax=Aliikangiella sp. IMCC44359 TaxID=3459125 RepID=UPI00403A9507